MIKKNSFKSNILTKNFIFLFIYRCWQYLKLSYKILRLAITDTISHDGVEHAGYLAFLSILSLFPFLIFLALIIGHFGGSEVGSNFIALGLKSLPKEVADTLTPRINEIILGPPQSFLTIAIIGVIWNASSVVEGCRTILNRAYRVAAPPPYILRRLLSIAEFFAIIFSVTIAMSVFVIGPIILKFVEKNLNFAFPINYDWLHLRFIAIYIILICTLSLIYYALPNSKQKITQTLPGAILAVALWIIVEKCFSLYLENFQQFNLVYGSLAGIIISLMFFYLNSLIFILGAEFNYRFHRTLKKLLP
jgi:membrane protein